MSKVIIESVQVARHVSYLGFRPVEKLAATAVQSGEDLAVWSLKLHPVQELLGRQRAAAALDSYFQAKEMAIDSMDSMRHQSCAAAFQTCADNATSAMGQLGMRGRVAGPFDSHWSTRKIIDDLRAAEMVRADKKRNDGTVRLTPKRFIYFMREAERKRKAARRVDPVDHWVERALHDGNLSSVCPRFLEKRVYRDVARLICFAFDRALKDVNGTNLWGHALKVGVQMDSEGSRHRSNIASHVGMEQIESVVDRMLMSEELDVPPTFEGVQRQLLTNCTLMLIQLIEDITSSDHLSANVLGHALRVSLEAMPLGEELGANDLPEGAHKFRVNTAVVDELVDAMMAEPEVQLWLIPNVVEAEIYRYALHRMICIAQYMLSQLEIRLFGNVIRMELVPTAMPEDDIATATDTASSTEVHVQKEDLDQLFVRIEIERQKIDHELRRRHNVEAAAFTHETLDNSEFVAADLDEEVHEFQTMAAQDKLARCLAVHRTVDVPIETAFSMVADVEDYSKWMPFCTDSRILPAEGDTERAFSCEVDFGIETGTMMGAVGDAITYRVTATPPEESAGDGDGPGLRTARCVADTPNGFRYAKRLVYDWRFKEVADGETDVRLDIFFQAGNMFSLPIWDNMQATITGAMMQKFTERADTLKARAEAPPDPARAGGAATEKQP